MTCTSMKIRKVRALAIAASVAAFGAMPQAFAAGDPLNFDIGSLQDAGAWVQYGDAQSYSLQIGCTQTGQTGTGCIYYVQSSTGQIKDLTVMGAHTGGQPVLTNSYPGTMDNAYVTPETSNNTGIGQLGDWFMRTGGETIGTGANTVTFGSTDPGGAGEWTGATAGSGDLANTWDVKLDSLMSFTDNKDPVFFFVNNQTNSGGTEDQNLAGWARLWITDDTTGAVIGVWEFTNDDSKYATVPDGGGVPGGNVGTYSVGAGVLGTDPSAGDNNATDYVLSGGKVCFDQLGAAPAPGDTIVSCSGAFDYSVANNLGDNQAAYALFFPEMNDLIASLSNLGKYTLHVDFRIGCDPAWYGSDPTATNIDSACLAKRLTNGGEAIFIGAAFERPPICETSPNLPECQPPTIPEPGTISLVGLALAGLGWGARRRKVVVSDESREILS